MTCSSYTSQLARYVFVLRPAFSATSVLTTSCRGPPPPEIEEAPIMFASTSIPSARHCGRAKSPTRQPANAPRRRHLLRSFTSMHLCTRPLPLIDLSQFHPSCACARTTCTLIPAVVASRAMHRLLCHASFPPRTGTQLSGVHCPTHAPWLRGNSNLPSASDATRILHARAARCLLSSLLTSKFCL